MFGKERDGHGDEGRPARLTRTLGLRRADDDFVDGLVFDGASADTPVTDAYRLTRSPSPTPATFGKTAKNDAAGGKR